MLAAWAGRCRWTRASRYVANASDVDERAALRAAGPRSGGAPSTTLSSRRGSGLPEHATRAFFVASRGGRPVSMANVKHYTRMPAAGLADAGTWGYVGNVFVLEEHRSPAAVVELDPPSRR